MYSSEYSICLQLADTQVSNYREKKDSCGFGCIAMQVTFGCYMARSYMALNQLGVTCFTGMSYVVRKSMLDEVGGLAYFGKYLAEDYFLSSALCQK
ncbi:unnamed protein product [Trichobilharzia regenti]|nr:unnamed protein product [Trichobilharzia regenti]